MVGACRVFERLRDWLTFEGDAASGITAQPHHAHVGQMPQGSMITCMYSLGTHVSSH